jgi:hypothetical protein
MTLGPSKGIMTNWTTPDVSLPAVTASRKMKKTLAVRKRSCNQKHVFRCGCMREDSLLKPFGLSVRMELLRNGQKDFQEIIY